MFNQLLITLALLVCVAHAGTGIFVVNNYKKEVNVKIAGAGVGGCDIVLNPGQNSTDCWCLWGTINYGFCAYSDGIVGNNSTVANAKKEESNVGNGRCDVVTGKSLLCSDVTSLGNCYNGAYSCTIDEGGFCHCITV